MPALITEVRPEMSFVIQHAASLADADILAQAIVNTLSEPFLVLDQELRVVTASRSFYETFKVLPEQTQGHLLYDLGDGQWDIPALRLLLETIIPDKVAMDGFEVEHDFPGIGRRTMLLNARKVLYADSPNITILLAFHDMTERRVIEQEKQALFDQSERLLAQQQLLLQEMQHRVANSLQIIGSILMLKARSVASEETRFHLKDAHQRVMSVAAVQQDLHAVDGIDQIDVRAYLTKLAAGLSSSMVGEDQPIAIRVTSDVGQIESADAVSLGLIVTELVINAIKYAFPAHKPDALIQIAYDIDGADWTLTISDNGTGLITSDTPRKSGGFGSRIVKALTQQLGAHLETHSSPGGLSTSLSKTAPLLA